MNEYLIIYTLGLQELDAQGWHKTNKQQERLIKCTTVKKIKNKDP